MKFLIRQLVSCCGCQEKGPHHTDEDRQQRTYLVRRRSTTTKSRSKSSRGGVATADWKPSLFAISEDNVILERNKSSETETETETETERLTTTNNNKRKIAGQQNAKPRVRSYDYEQDNWGYSMHTAMPAFSPTPFMF